MMRQAIVQCPPELWVSAQGHAAPCWRVAFHALFFTHFYLHKNHRSMKRWAKHRGDRGHLEDLSGPPAAAEDVYTQAELLEYLEFCLEMLDRSLAAMDLASADCGFPWYEQGKLEHQINNIRHLQHHAAQLGDRLGSATGHGIDWK
jgi:hypothetical protein